MCSAMRRLYCVVKGEGDDFWSVSLLVLLIMTEGSALCAAGVNSIKVIIWLKETNRLSELPAQTARNESFTWNIPKTVFMTVLLRDTTAAV